MDHDGELGQVGWKDYLLFYATVAGGLASFALLGLAARSHLIARGAEVVAFGHGEKLLLPLALVFEIPVLVIAVMNLRVLGHIGSSEIRGALRLHLALTTLTTETGDLARIRAGQGGAALGTILAMAQALWGALTSTGPGGFAEVVALSLSMAPLIMLSLLVLAAVGAFLGGACGVLALQGLRRLTRRS